MGVKKIATLEEYKDIARQAYKVRDELFRLCNMSTEKLTKPIMRNLSISIDTLDKFRSDTEARMSQHIDDFSLFFYDRDELGIPDDVSTGWQLPLDLEKCNLIEENRDLRIIVENRELRNRLPVEEREPAGDKYQDP